MDQNRAAVRLMKDWKELQVRPVKSASASPIDDDLFRWHGNIVGSGSVFKDAVFHLVMEFTEDYPNVPPKIDLCTTIPHPNVFAGQKGCRNFICLDMLEQGSFTPEELNRPFAGWSSSYTVGALLVQLSTFLLEDKLLYAKHKITPEVATSHALKFTCDKCQHRGEKPWPPICPEAVAPLTRVVALPQMRAAQKILQQIVPAEPARPTTKPTTAKATTAAAVKAKVPEKVEEKVEAPERPKEQWVTVTHKKVPKAAINFGAPVKNGKKGKPKAGHTVANSGAAGKEKVKEVVKEEAPATATTTMYHALLTLAAMEKEQRQKEAQKAAQEAAEARAERMAKEQQAAKERLDRMTPAQRKRFLRNKEVCKARAKKYLAAKKAAAAGEVSAATPAEAPVSAPATTTVTPAAAPVEAVVPAPVISAPKAQSKTPVCWADEDDSDDDGFVDSGKPKKEEAREWQWSSTLPVADSSLDVTVPDTSYLPMGNLDSLPYQMLVNIVGMLPLRTVASLSRACRGLYRLTQDGVLWKTFFSRYYPNASVTVEKMKDWKRLFTLEVDQVLSSLVCFHTKVDFREDVLGLPIEFTVNPRTEQIDYVYSSMDILSRQAFTIDNVRKTVWKEKFTQFLPIYIDEDHFRRGLPLLQRTLTRMTNGGSFHPMMVLDVLPKMLNTLVVLLMDKGIHASTKALDGYFMIHRLFIALVKEYPQLSNAIDEKLRTFTKDPEARVKSSLPSLGDFLTLLSVSDKFSWDKISWLYLAEVFDRNVLWIGKADVSLISPPADQKAGVDRLNKIFQAVKVSQKLTLFHVYFLRMKRGKNLDTVAADYDMFYGRPNHAARAAFQKAVQAIGQVEGWPGFFSHLGLVTPKPEALASWLSSSVGNSKRKGYHSNRTNFSAIQASGVSSILKKGQSYQASSHVKKVKMEESWGYENDTQFLDASCLIYDFFDKFISRVDWCHRTELNGAITHSGDVMDARKKEGKHTILVNLTQLPPTVKCLWFTMTAFTNTLAEIKQPWVRFTDVESDQEMCSYNVEDAANNQSNTCIIMCKMERSTPTSNWAVTAIGQIGMGNASNYGPIKTSIAAMNKKTDK